VLDDSGATYGSPPIGIELREQGWQVSDNTIALAIAELGLAGRVQRRRRGPTRPGKRPAAPDLVNRVFTAPAPDVAWCGDMTEIVTGAAATTPRRPGRADAHHRTARRARGSRAGAADTGAGRRPGASAGPPF
jgi:transposase InsO family protein